MILVIEKVKKVFYSPEVIIKAIVKPSKASKGKT